MFNIEGLNFVNRNLVETAKLTLAAAPMENLTLTDQKIEGKFYSSEQGSGTG